MDIVLLVLLFETSLSGLLLRAWGATAPWVRCWVSTWEPWPGCSCCCRTGSSCTAVPLPGAAALPDGRLTRCGEDSMLSHRRRFRRLAAILLLCGTVACGGAPGAAPDVLTILAPASPGGGWDQTGARHAGSAAGRWSGRQRARRERRRRGRHHRSGAVRQRRGGTGRRPARDRPHHGRRGADQPLGRHAGADNADRPPDRRLRAAGGPRRLAARHVGHVHQGLEAGSRRARHRGRLGRRDRPHAGGPARRARRTGSDRRQLRAAFPAAANRSPRFWADRWPPASTA